MDTEQNTIAHCGTDELKPGHMGQLFLTGAKAIILDGDERVQGILHSLTMPGNDSDYHQSELNPWHSRLIDIARNHQPDNPDSGDIIRFIPGKLGHIARKISLTVNADGQMCANPSSWSIDGRLVAVPEHTLWDAWNIMTEVLRSTLPANQALPEYSVNLEILSYPKHFDDITGIYNLLENSGGTWTRLGHRLDLNKSQVAGALDVFPLNHLVSALMLLPGIGPLVSRFNASLRGTSHKATLDNENLIADPHLDKIKVVTALCGARVNLKTELHDGREWLEMPITSDMLAIFPSEQVKDYSAIESTLHRVVMQQQESDEKCAEPNVTISISVVARKDLWDKYLSDQS